MADPDEASGATCVPATYTFFREWMEIVDPERLELPTPAFEAQCSIQLSYGSDCLKTQRLLHSHHCCLCIGVSFVSAEKSTSFSTAAKLCSGAK